MKKILFLFIILISTAQHTFSQALPDSIHTYLVRALEIMKQHSINKNNVDWEALYAQALEQAKGAETVRETYPAINSAIAELKDHHSRLYAPEIIKALKEEGYNAATSQKLPMPIGNMIDGKYAYISIPGFSAMRNEEQLAFVDSVQSTIRFLDAQKPKGWIVDLRLNQGGNFEPTIAGLMPLLGEGKWIGWADADNIIDYPAYKNGKIIGLFDSLTHAIQQPYWVRNQNLPVSVLIGSKTGSSGEMAAITFVGRRHTKLIGTITGGLTTSNQPFELPDGAWLNLTTSKSADRNGKIYGNDIKPDIALHLTNSAITNSYLYINAAIRHIEKPKK